MEDHRAVSWIACTLATTARTAARLWRALLIDQPGLHALHHGVRRMVECARPTETECSLSVRSFATSNAHSAIRAETPKTAAAHDHAWHADQQAAAHQLPALRATGRFANAGS
jgi:hypothetical protein